MSNNSIKAPEYINNTTIRGTVVRKTQRDNILIFAVATVNPATQKTDFPNLFVFDAKTIEEMSNDVGIGDRVTFNCSIQTSKKYPMGTVVVNNYSKELSRIDSEINEETYKADLNKVLLKGKLARPVYHPTNTVSIFSLKVINENNFAVYPTLVCFNNASRKVLDKNVGDDIVALCHIKTDISDTEPRTTKQTIIVQNIK